MRKFVLLTITLALMTGLMALGCGGGGSSSAPFLESFVGNTDPAYIDTTEAVSLALKVGFAGRDSLEYVDDTPDVNVEAESTSLNQIDSLEPLAVPSGSDCSTTTESGSHGGTLESGICITPAEDLLLYGDATDYATTTQYWDGYFELVTDFVSKGQYSFESYSYADPLDVLLHGP